MSNSDQTKAWIRSLFARVEGTDSKERFQTREQVIEQLAGCIFPGSFVEEIRQLSDEDPKPEVAHGGTANQSSH